jgi:large subunit ribosomal protein L35
MPKMKTHSGSKKRFRVTATGKVRGRKAFSTHILEKKSPKRKRKMRQPVVISPHDVPRVKTLLGEGRRSRPGQARREAEHLSQNAGPEAARENPS